MSPRAKLIAMKKIKLNYCKENYIFNIHIWILFGTEEFVPVKGIIRKTSLTWNNFMEPTNGEMENNKLFFMQNKYNF